MHGSSCWDLFSPECQAIYTAWNVAVRQILRLERKTHRFLIEPLSQNLHMRTMLLSRFAKFYNCLQNSKKMTVRFLAKMNESDNRTILGKTLHLLLQDCKIDDLCCLNATKVKSHCVYWPQQDQLMWQVDIAMKLMFSRENRLEVPGFSKQEIDEIFNHVHTS